MSRVKLRRATEADCEFVLACRNDPESIRNSLSNRAITPDEHRAWFHDGQARGARYVFVAETITESARIGTCNVEREGWDGLRVGIALDPQWRGEGYGQEVLDALVAYARRRWSGERLFAHILRDNVASQIAFRKAGFKPIQDVETVEIR